MELSRQDIERLFERLNGELERSGILGEVYLAGGAVICPVFDARASTLDVGAFFRPEKELRATARRVALGTRGCSRWSADFSAWRA